MRKVLAVLFLVLAVGCFLSMLFGFYMAIDAFYHLAQSNASGHEYLPVLVAMGLVELAALGQTVFSGLCLWLSEHKVIRALAGAGTAVGGLIFCIVLMLSFMR